MAALYRVRILQTVSIRILTHVLAARIADLGAFGMVRLKNVNYAQIHLAIVPSAVRPQPALSAAIQALL